jgi:hypothetical protein
MQLIKFKPQGLSKFLQSTSMPNDVFGPKSALILKAPSELLGYFSMVGGNSTP